MKSENDGGHKYIVGIGASAGGLEALQKLLTALSPTTGFPYIIVQHLSPDYKSMLVHILSKYTSMPVAEATDGCPIENDHIYIIQPGKLMTVEDDALHLTDQVPRELNLPIDTFFYSLAKEAGPRAIAIVLSGTGSDGSNGIKAVKEHDGLVIAQDLDSCKFDGMPRSAMRTGVVDAQITPEEMALELKHISETSASSSHEKSDRDVDTEILTKVYLILQNASNINFAHYKQATVIRRMERRMMLCHKEKPADYVEFLRESPDEAKILAREILIGVTGFFRDPEYFEILKEKAINEILSESTPDEPIRIWVAGCSTGEEAYSIAILFSEAMDNLQMKRAVKIFATDLDCDAIAIASKGVYGDNIIESMSPIRLLRYFTRKSNTYTVNRDIRRMIVFSTHNIIQDPPFGKLDLISCRNMLIYFQPVLQNDLFAIFHQSLRDGGFLFLGKSEAIGAHTEAFPVVDPVAKIFTHRKNVKIAGSSNFTLPRLQYMGDDYSSATAESQPQNDSPIDEEAEDNIINNQLMQRFMPSGVIVNKKNELVRSYGDTGNFIRLSAGKFSSNLFDILTNGLMIPVSTLLKEARDKNRETSYSDIPFKGEKKNAVVDLTVMPVGTKKLGDDGTFALVFTQSSHTDAKEKPAAYDVDKAAAQRIADLEQELGFIKGKLDRSMADQECVNTELQATNEELLTANEELQSSNEELQSVNEELYTVNSEYQQKLNELNDLNDDIANFLSCTMTGIIFVDEKLNIRRYTDYMTSEFSVMEQDIGRSLALLSYHFPSVDITGICDYVLKTLAPDEREVITSRKKVFFMRVSPYRSTENRIMGCVIALMDITSQKRGQETLIDAEKRLTAVNQAMDARSDYLIHVAQQMHTPVDALKSLSSAAKKLASGNSALMADIDRITENVSYMDAIVDNMSHLTISHKTSADGVLETGAEANTAPDAQTDASEGAPAPSADDACTLAGRKVLIAEDNALNRTLIATMLEKSGIMFAEAKNGQEAVKMFTESPENTFDCILMDMKMPRLSGAEACEKIRASNKKDAKTVPIIGLLAMGYDDDVEQSQKAGMNGCLTKPVDSDRLFKLMTKLMT